MASTLDDGEVVVESASRRLPLDPDSPSLLFRWTEEHLGSFIDEPGGFVRDVEGSVVEIDEAGEAVAGRFSILYVDIAGALNAGYPLFDVMDYSQTTSHYSAVLYQDGGPEFRPEVLKVLGDESGDLNLLILDRLELLPPYRGAGLGLKLLCEMMRRFGPGAGVVAINPFPLQFEHTRREPDAWRRAMELRREQDTADVAAAKLRRHYAKLGFRRIPRTEYMVRSMDSALPRFKD